MFHHRRRLRVRTFGTQTVRALQSIWVGVSIPQPTGGPRTSFDYRFLVRTSEAGIRVYPYCQQIESAGY